LTYHKAIIAAQTRACARLQKRNKKRNKRKMKDMIKIKKEEKEMAEKKGGAEKIKR